VDTLNNRIEKFDKEGNFVLSFGSGGKDLGKFRLPVGVALDKDGNIYITDTLNKRIQKFNNQGTPIYEINEVKEQGSDETLTFKLPSGIALDKDNNIYVSDTLNNRILKIDEEGNLLLLIDGEGETKPPLPVGYQSLEDALEKLNGEDFFALTIENLQEWIRKPLKLPQGLFIDNFGSIYVVDRLNNRVQKFDRWGNRLLNFGRFGREEGEFILPIDLALDPANDYLYITDTHNHRIEKFRVRLEAGEKGKTKLFKGQVGIKLSLAEVYNYPNPFNSNLEETTIHFNLSKDAEVNIYIYDVVGKLVKSFDTRDCRGGENDWAKWDGRNDQGRRVANGVYIIYIEAKVGSERVEAVKKLAVLK